MSLKDKIVTVRFIKNYASAHNHIAVGRVVDESDHYLLLECRTIHFGKLVRNPSRIEHGETSLRALPWHRIELMHVLDDDTDWASELTMDERGYISLSNGGQRPLLKLSGRKPPRGAAKQDPFICEREEGVE